jgi:hypothetical protein
VDNAVKRNGIQSVKMGHRLNYHIPSDTLGKAPLVAFPKAKHSGRYFNPLLEKKYFDQERIKDYLHLKERFRKVSDIKTISLLCDSFFITTFCRLSISLVSHLEY